MLIIFCLAFIAFASCFEPRIIGGTPTTITKHSYQVSIQYKSKHLCGGSIISEKWILTAAHCVYGYTKPLSFFKVRVGSTYHDKGGILKDIISIICHEKFHKKSYDYDVALIKLSISLTWAENIKPILLALPLMNIKAGTQAIVTGWGKTANGSSSNVLQSVTVPVIEQKKCQKIWAPYRIIVTSNMICAGDVKGEKDTCSGDSGGALVSYNGLQIGIVSWGTSVCASVGFSGVYTRVPAIRQWITKQTNV